MTAPDMSLLVDLVERALTRYGKDTTPLLDPLETDGVQRLFDLDPIAAEAYVAGRLTHATKRIREVEDGLKPFADPFRHAQVALGAHAFLLQLHAAVTA